MIGQVHLVVGAYRRVVIFSDQTLFVRKMFSRVRGVPDNHLLRKMNITPCVARYYTV